MAAVGRVTRLALGLALAGAPACVEPCDAPTQVRALVPARAIALTDGWSEVVSFEVPADALSVVVSIAGPTSHHLGVGSWRGPNGALVPADWVARRSPAEPQACTTCAHRVWLARGGAAAMMVSLPGAPLAPGRHEVRVVALADLADSQGSGELTATIVVEAKTGPELPAMGTIDLDVHLASTRWTAASAPGDDELEAILDEARVALAGGGLALGEIHFRDGPPRSAVVRGTDTADAPVFTLVQAAPATDGVDVFLVDRLHLRARGDTSPARGWASSIPVAGPGGSRPAIVVAVEGQTFVGRALAHELGHALGLFHTSEAFAGSAAERAHDELADTPEDDRDLLLHYRSFGTGWSPTQGAIVRSHPRVRHGSPAP